MLRFFPILLLCGCSTYHERFTHYRPDGGTNHVVNVGFNNFLMYGKAGKLATQTQTEEFIRNVNGENLEMRPDAQAIKAIVEGVVESLLKQWKPAP